MEMMMGCCLREVAAYRLWLEDGVGDVLHVMAR